ncbi:MAG TPA: twin-arginine translocase subunit TatC, partial [Tepidisphaeraceae bacterium]|nr:twin-arginine translocase subunit TatC [Tepidisphaeraceae bacterium]
AAGLYPNERKTVTRYIPLSMALLIAGVLFVYFAVLPLTVDFFLTFNGEIPLPDIGPTPVVALPNSPTIIPVLHGDPANPPDGFVWFNDLQSELKIKIPGGLREITFTAPNLIASTFTLDDYIGFVLMFMVVFGVAFQLPLVMLALVSVGLVETEFLRKQRKIVWFIMAVVAAVIAPGDVVTSMLALLIPMVFLYEFGIWLAEWGIRRRERVAAAEESEH